MADVGLDGLTDLGLPFGVGIDGVANVLAQFSDVGVQQLEKALLLAGELVVERALGRARVPDDIGDGAGTVSALGDRGREAIEKALPKRVDLGGVSRGSIFRDSRRHRRLLLSNQRHLNPCQHLVPHGTVPE